MSSNTNPAPQLSKEVVLEIKAKAIDYASGIVFNSAWMNAEKIAEKRTEASVDYQAGATEYATKLRMAQQNIEKVDTKLLSAIDLLREVFQKHGAIICIHDSSFYNKIKMFLYGE